MKGNDLTIRIFGMVNPLALCDIYTLDVRGKLRLCAALLSRRSFAYSTIEERVAWFLCFAACICARWARSFDVLRLRW